LAETTHNETTDVRAAGLSEIPLIWLIGADAAIMAQLSERIQALEGQYDTVVIEEPTRLLAATHPALPVLCCLLESMEAEDTRRAVALLRKLAGAAPILLIDRYEAGFDLMTARKAGAWDHCPIADPALLSARLSQALEVGRQRQELIAAGERLNTAQRRLDVLLSEGQDARARIVDHHIENANAAFARLLGARDVEAVHGGDLLAWVAHADQQALRDALDKTVQETIDTSLVFNLESSSARPRPVRGLLRPATDNAVDIVLRDADDRRLQFAERAMRPPMDGRMALHNVLADTAGRAQEHMLGAIFVAVDEIEMLQSQFGLARSDLLLQEIGLFLLATLRGEDRCFRFGAGEYVLLIERQSTDEIAAAAGRIHAAFAEELFGDELHSVHLSASITHNALTDDAGANDRCLQRIMESAYALRRDGGDACLNCSETVAEPNDAPAVDVWSRRLREALAQDRFSLAYQGITSLAGDSQTYFDVLLRYIDDRGALVRPGEFLAVAEATDLMPEIDRWVTARAIGVIAAQLAGDTEIALFVKLSVATIVAGGAFLRWLNDTIATTEVPRRCLIFSFREDDVRTQARAAKTLATELDAQGFRVALTHFGSTPKAAQMLDDLPASFVKLAPNFAKEIADGEDERLLRAIASTRERKLPLIAEQIEDAHSMARLWQAGVNYVQGHFIQEPDTEALAHSGNHAI
jgi:diguanylate cyclase (GGDEF)-like protein